MGDDSAASSSDDEGSQSSADHSGSEHGERHQNPVGLKGMSKEERKAHKHAVKEDNRERRKHKMPKHVKKKLVNKHKRK